MSLEKQISVLSERLEVLTGHIEKLTAALHTGEQDLVASGLYAGEEVAKAEPVKEVKPEKVKPTGPVAETEQVEILDFETFRRQCVDAARDPKIGKAHVKEVIASFGAKKAVDVKEADRAKVLVAINTPF